MNTKRKNIGIVLGIVGALFIFIGVIFSIFFNEEKISYKYKFGNEFLDGFDFNNSEEFKGVYKYNSLTEKYENAFDDYYSYSYYDNDKKNRYLLFFKKNYSKYFFFDIKNNSIVENNKDVIKDVFFGHISCSGLCYNLGMCFDLQCEEASDYFELYLFDTCDMYYVDVDGSVIAIEEKKCYSESDDIMGYDFYDGDYYGNMRVSNVSAKELGLNNDFKIGDHFNIVYSYDTECCSDYFALNAKTKKIKLLGSYCDC